MVREAPRALVSIPSSQVTAGPHAGWAIRDDDPDDASTDPSSQSPLWMVTNEPTLNQFVSDLQTLRVEFLESPNAERELRFSRAGLEEVRASFAHMIRN